MSKQFLNSIGYKDPEAVRTAGDELAATADQVADHLEGAEQALKEGNVDEGMTRIRGALCQLTNVVVVAHSKQQQGEGRQRSS